MAVTAALFGTVKWRPIGLGREISGIQRHQGQFADIEILLNCRQKSRAYFCQFSGQRQCFGNLSSSEDRMSELSFLVRFPNSAPSFPEIVMNRAHLTASVFVACLTSQLMAQPPNSSTPTKEHAFLQKFSGTWKSESDCSMGPGQPAIRTTATMTSRMIGKFWVVSEITSTGGGASVTAIQTIGYDAKKKKYVSTWIDSMFNHMWHSEGTLNEEGTTLTLEAEGPNFMTGKGTAKFRDVYEFKSADHIVATSASMDKNGKWVEFVNGHSKRVKQPKE